MVTENVQDIPDHPADGVLLEILQGTLSLAT